MKGWKGGAWGGGSGTGEGEAPARVTASLGGSSRGKNWLGVGTGQREKARSHTEARGQRRVEAIGHTVTLTHARTHAPTHRRPKERRCSTCTKGEPLCEGPAADTRDQPHPLTIYTGPRTRMRTPVLVNTFTGVHRRHHHHHQDSQSFPSLFPRPSIRQHGPPPVPLTGCSSSPLRQARRSLPAPASRRPSPSHDSLHERFATTFSSSTWFSSTRTQCMSPSASQTLHFIFFPFP